jgi:hypothetical protein
MSLDVNQLLGLTSALAVAKADYDFDRDGGGPYALPVNTELIPAGALIVGASVYTDEALVFSAGGTLYFRVQGTIIAAASATEGYITGALITGVAGLLTDRAVGIEVYVDTSALTAGKARAAVYYILP